MAWLEHDVKVDPRRVLEQRQNHRKALDVAKVKAWKELLHFVERTAGTDRGARIRFWRRTLDPMGNFYISTAAMRRFLRKIHFRAGAGSLWRALDKDGDGQCSMEELDVTASDRLAHFRRWARQRYGRCVALWETEAFRDVFRPPRHDDDDHYHTASIDDRHQTFLGLKKLTYVQLRRCLALLDYHPVKDPKGVLTPSMQVTALMQSLDRHGCGFVELADFKWLDQWTTPEWLGTQEDAGAWHALRSTMQKRHGHLLKAWRKLLDCDGSNRVSWGEFRDACVRLKFKGNIGGAWRHLDEDFSGYITLREVDEDSFNLLNSFKLWCDGMFGSVAEAFRMLDKDGGGSLTFSELRRACRRRTPPWDGEVRLLFECLDVGGSKTGERRSVAFDEIAFLDKWEDVQAEGQGVGVTLPDETKVRRPRVTHKGPLEGGTAKGGDPFSFLSYQERPSPRKRRDGNLSQSSSTFMEPYSGQGSYSHASSTFLEEDSRLTKSTGSLPKLSMSSTGTKFLPGASQFSSMSSDSQLWQTAWGGFSNEAPEGLERAAMEGSRNYMGAAYTPALRREKKGKVWAQMPAPWDLFPLANIGVNQQDFETSPESAAKVGSVPPRIVSTKVSSIQSNPERPRRRPCGLGGTDIFFCARTPLSRQGSRPQPVGI